MNNKQSFLSRFFSHNITLLVLAFLIAFAAWFVINASSETDTNVTISDIPIIVDLPESAVSDGLKVFNAENLKGSVEVSGNRVTVGSLTSSDLSIVANQSNSIISPGSYTLSLSAKKTGLMTNYNIVSSVTPATVTVFVDKEKEQVFDIENKLTVKLNDSSHYANTSLSQTKVNVTGPETQVSQIASVAVEDTITGQESDKTFQEKLYFYDENGNKLDLPLVVTDIDTVEVTISVLPISTVSLGVNVTNAPKDYPEVSVSPSTVKIAATQDTLNKIEDGTVNIGALDFSKLKNTKNSMKYDITVPNGCKVISGETTATVSVDLSSYVLAEVTGKISSKIDSSDYDTEFATNNIELSIYCPSDLAEEISSSDVTVIADFTGLLDNLKAGNPVSLSVPLKVTLASDYSTCWVYGSYTTTVNVTKK